MMTSIAPFGLSFLAVMVVACGSSSSESPPAPMCGADVRVGQFTLELKHGENGAAAAH
jgi:hypothetical protein